MALLLAVTSKPASAIRTLCRFGARSTARSCFSLTPNVVSASLEGPQKMFRRGISGRGGDQIRRHAGKHGETGLSQWLADPLNEFGIHSPMLDLTNRMFGELLSSPARVSGAVSPFSVPLDLVEKETEYVATAELPGMDAEDVSISVDNRVLTFKAAHEEKREEKSEEGKGRVIHSERRSRSFMRQFRLPKDVNEEEISASMDKGLLTLTLPRVPTDQPSGRSIPVNKADSSKAKRVVPDIKDSDE